MPKPYLFHRHSHRYVRFFLPVALRRATGRRFLVRRLPDDPDVARLCVASIALSLSQQGRQGAGVTASGKHFGRPSLTVSQAVPAHLERLRERGITPDAERIATLDAFAFVNSRPVAELTSEHCRRWIRELKENNPKWSVHNRSVPSTREVSPEKRERMAGFLDRFLDDLVGQHLIPRNPMREAVPPVEAPAEKPTASGLMLPNGIRLDGVAFQNASDQALVQQALAGLATVASVPVQASAVPVATTTGLRLSKAIDAHLSDLERQGLDNKTLIESRHSLRILLGLAGDIPVRDIGADQLREFLDEVRHFPRNASKRKEYDGLTVRQILRKAKANHEPDIAGHTLAKHYSRVNVFLNSLVTLGEMNRNPLDAISLKTDKRGHPESTGRAFTNDELQLIFGSDYLPWSAKYAHRFWAPILGLYSGARVNELAQLYKDDFREVDGRWGYLIDDQHPDQQVKNSGSHRFVPLAEPVIQAGFLDWFQQVQTARIFPHLPGSRKLAYGRQLSRQFSVYIKDIGITDKHLGFHGFRHTLSTVLHDAGASDQSIAVLTGHKIQAGTSAVLRTFYIDSTKHGRIDPIAVKEAIRVVDGYRPGVKIPSYRDWLATQKRKP